MSWELARSPYLARVIWSVRGALTLVVMNREQTELAALAVDAATGATRPLVVDRDPAWINIAPDPLIWLPDGTGFLWMTERRGAWSLERYAADGAALGPALMPDVGLRRVAGLSADGRDVIIEATSDPREQHVRRAPITGGPATALTSGGGVHRVQTGHGVLVIRSANRAGGQHTTVVRTGGPSVELPSVAEHPKSAAMTELETLTLEDHLQYAAVTRPHGFDPKVRYPVVLRINSEPNSDAVVDARDTYAADQWCADAGFIVVRTDGRGIPGRDRLWQRVIAGDALTLPMNDQIAALKQLGAHHPELDLARVGVVGADLGRSPLRRWSDRRLPGRRHHDLHQQAGENQLRRHHARAHRRVVRIDPFVPCIVVGRKVLHVGQPHLCGQQLRLRGAGGRQQLIDPRADSPRLIGHVAERSGGATARLDKGRQRRDGKRLEERDARQVDDVAVDDDVVDPGQAGVHRRRF